jgi:hypothetical protein
MKKKKDTGTRKDVMECNFKIPLLSYIFYDINSGREEQLDENDYQEGEGLIHT